MLTEIPAESGSDSPLFMVSTQSVHPEQSIDYWRETVCDRIVPLDFQLPSRRSFDAVLQWSKFGELTTSHICATPHIVHRNMENIRRAGSDSLVLNFILAGSCEAEQDGRQTLIQRGGCVFVNAARPYSLHFHEPVELAVVQLPRTLLSRPLGGMDQITAQDLMRASPLLALAQAYVRQLIDCSNLLNPSCTERVAKNLSDLISIVFEESLQQYSLPLSEHKAAALARVRLYIEDHLTDEGLGPQQVAQSLNVSVRYINKLLEAENTSLGRFIWRRRLERIADDLRNPACATRSISCIALFYGFNDLTHFSKAFRQRFGMTPRDWRQQ